MPGKRKQRFDNRCRDCHTRDVPKGHTRCYRCRTKSANQAATQPQLASGEAESIIMN